MTRTTRIKRGVETPRPQQADNKKVAACARFARSGERGTEAAPATSEALQKMAVNQGAEETVGLKSWLYIYNL